MFKNSDINKFIKSYQTKLAKIEQNAVNAVEKFLSLVENTSQSYVPVKTGELRKSFYTRIENNGKSIVGVAGYDENGSLSHYAKIMHEGFWPSDFWTGNLARLNGTAINYHKTYQPTPRSHFLLLGFVDNKKELGKLIKEIFDGI